MTWLCTKHLKQRLNVHFVVLCFEFNWCKNGKDVQICSPRHKQTPGMVRDPVSSFLGIVMLMMVLVIGAVYQRLTAQPAPPPLSPSECSCVLSCSAVFLELYFMFSVSSQFQNMCLHECINKH